MEENNILSGDINSLRECIETVNRYMELKKESAAAAEDVKRLDRDVAQAKKAMQAETESTLKKNRAPIVDHYKDEIGKKEDDIRKLKSKRDKARNKGVKERIGDETRDLVSQNKELRKRMKSEIKDNKLSKICGKSFYFTFFHTKGAGEAFIFALAVILLCFILPGVVWIILPFEKLADKWQLVSLALMYFAIILLVVAIYWLMSKTIKRGKTEALNSLREIRNQIKSNDRQIKKITRSVKRDSNESMYNLGSFDNKLAELEDAVKESTSKRDAELANFDNNISRELADEIAGRHMPGIRELEAKKADAVAHHEDLDRQVTEMTRRINAEYEVYLGKDMVNPTKLEGLLTVMETGNAATVGEAREVYRNTKTK